MLILHIARLNPKPSLRKHNLNQVKHFAKLKDSDFPSVSVLLQRNYSPCNHLDLRLGR